MLRGEQVEMHLDLLFGPPREGGGERTGPAGATRTSRRPADSPSPYPTQGDRAASPTGEPQGGMLPLVALASRGGK